MNVKEKELRVVIHDKKIEKYSGFPRNTGLYSLLDLENQLVEYQETKNCALIPIRPMGRTSGYWSVILGYNFEDWKRLVNSSPYDFVAYQVFNMTRMSCDMRETVDVIIRFYFSIQNNMAQFTDPVLLGFLTHMEFWGNELLGADDPETGPYFPSEFRSPLHVGESKLRVGEGYTEEFDDNYEHLFVNTDAELRALMNAVKLFLEQQGI